MSQLVECPECKKHLQVPDNLLGKKVQCPECKHAFTAKAPDEDEGQASKTGTTASKPAAPSKTAAWDMDSGTSSKRGSDKKKRKNDDDEDYAVEDNPDDDDDDLPRRRSKRRRDSSRRGSYAPHRGGMIMAFGLIGLIGGFVAGLPVVFGIVAWVMGNTDLAEMKAGRMDPEGEGMTQAGKIMGMIATILAAVSIVIGCVGFGCWFVFVAMIVGGAAAGGANNNRPVGRFK